MKLRSPVAVLFALSLSVAACGGGDEQTAGGEQAGGESTDSTEIRTGACEDQTVGRLEITKTAVVDASCAQATEVLQGALLADPPDEFSVKDFSCQAAGPESNGARLYACTGKDTAYFTFTATS